MRHNQMQQYNQTLKCKHFHVIVMANIICIVLRLLYSGWTICIFLNDLSWTHTFIVSSLIVIANLILDLDTVSNCLDVGLFWLSLCKFWTFMQNKTTTKIQKKKLSLFRVQRTCFSSFGHGHSFQNVYFFSRFGQFFFSSILCDEHVIFTHGPCDMVKNNEKYIGERYDKNEKNIIFQEISQLGMNPNAQKW